MLIIAGRHTLIKQSVTNMVGILLAAGFSRRFGATDKLMHTLADGRPIALAAAENMMAALPCTIAVVRPDNATLAALLANAGATVMHCAPHELDMADSLVAAIRHSSGLAEASDGFIVGLGDMPFIHPATIGRIADALVKAQGDSIVVPVFQNQRGHPVGFSAGFRDELENLHGDQGARAILRRHQQAIHLLECDDSGILRDIDTLADVIAP